MKKPSDYGFKFGEQAFVFSGQAFTDTDKVLVRACTHNSVIQIENSGVLKVAHLSASDEFFFDVGRPLLRVLGEKSDWQHGSVWDWLQCTGKDVRLALLAIERLEVSLAQAEPLISDYQNSRDYDRPVWAEPRECRGQRHPRTGKLYDARELPDTITDYYTFCAKQAAWERCADYAELLKNEPAQSTSNEAQLQYWRKALKGEASCA